MGKKLNTFLFVAAGTVLDILLAIAAAAVLVMLLYFCRDLVPEGAMPLMMSVAAICGIILGMIAYQRIAAWVIRKFNLEDKLYPLFRSGKQHPD